MLAFSNADTTECVCVACVGVCGCVCMCVCLHSSDFKCSHHQAVCVLCVCVWERVHRYVRVWVCVCLSVLQCWYNCCSLLQLVAACCSLLQLVAACCSLLQHVAQTYVDTDMCVSMYIYITLHTLQHTAKYCNLMQLTHIHLARCFSMHSGLLFEFERYVWAYKHTRTHERTHL